MFSHIDRWCFASLFSIFLACGAPADTTPNDAEKLLLEETFPARPEDAGDRSGPRTDAVLILQSNQIIFEKYGRDCNAERKHISWSIAKSMTNAIVGNAVLTQGFDLKKNVCTLKKPACQIPAQAFLEMSSGLTWLETYEKAADPTQSDVIRMLYGEGHTDGANYVQGRAIAGPPYSFWRYSSGDPVMLLSAARQHLGAGAFKKFLKQFLSEGLGLKSFTFEEDAAGLPRAASHFYATARDFSQLGTLFLNDGVLNGKRLLPEGWVRYSTTPVSAYLKERRDWDSKSVGGAGWWLNTDFPDRPGRRPWPSAPKDTFLAQGHWGQAVAVIPSLKVVAVRLGDTRDRSFFSNDGFLKSVIRFVQAQPPRPEPPPTRKQGKK